MLFKAKVYNFMQLQGLCISVNRPYLESKDDVSGFVLHVFIVGDSVKDHFCETSVHLDAKAALLSPHKHQASFSSK